MKSIDIKRILLYNISIFLLYNDDLVPHACSSALDGTLFFEELYF